MLRFSLFLILTLLITACTQTSLILQDKKPQPQELSSKIISKIAIPIREEGYSNFETQTIKSEKELNRFVAKVKKEKHWNQKENFLDSLLLKKIDFTAYNLLLYRMTKNSGADVLSVDVPVGDKETILINIDSDTASVGTADMAYYALAYKVSKSIKTVTFKEGEKKTLIDNRTTLTNNQEIPKDCMEWFDGCNSCGRVGVEGIPVCTKMACPSYQEFRCTKWKE